MYSVERLFGALQFQMLVCLDVDGCTSVYNSCFHSTLRPYLKPKICIAMSLNYDRNCRIALNYSYSYFINI